MAPAANKKGGDLIPNKPITLNFLNSSPTIKVAFKNTWFIPTCRKI